MTIAIVILTEQNMFSKSEHILKRLIWHCLTIHWHKKNTAFSHNANRIECRAGFWIFRLKGMKCYSSQARWISLKVIVFSSIFCLSSLVLLCQQYKVCVRCSVMLQCVLYTCNRCSRSGKVWGRSSASFTSIETEHIIQLQLTIAKISRMSFIEIQYNDRAIRPVTY